MTWANDILLSQRQAAHNVDHMAALASLQPREALLATPPAAGATLLWAKAGTYWKNAVANNSYVDAYPCDDRAGTNPKTGDPLIRIYLPRAPGSDPNVVLDQVVGYFVDGAGANIAAACYLDAAIGTVRLWSRSGALPAGWVDCAPGTGASSHVESLAGSFPVGLKAGDSDFGTLGNFGNQGRKTHAHALERDVFSPPPPEPPVWFDEGQWQTMHVSTAVANHLPPWCVVRFIERIDNSR